MKPTTSFRIPDNHDEQRTEGTLTAISGGGEVFNHVEGEQPMWSGEGDREVRLPVMFEKAFAAPPVISIGTVGLDSAKSTNLRYSLDAVDITADGFVIVFKTWGDTRIARASANWIAFGTAKQKMQLPQTNKSKPQRDNKLKPRRRNKIKPQRTNKPRTR